MIRWLRRVRREGKRARARMRRVSPTFGVSGRLRRRQADGHGRTPQPHPSFNLLVIDSSGTQTPATPNCDITSLRLYDSATDFLHSPHHNATARRTDPVLGKIGGGSTLKSEVTKNTSTSTLRFQGAADKGKVERSRKG